MRRVLTTAVVTGALALGACGEMEADDASTSADSVIGSVAVGDAVVSASDLQAMPELRPGQIELARFVGYADPTTGEMRIDRVFETAEGQRLRTVGQANWCDATIVQDGVTGSNPDDTIELYTVEDSTGSMLPGGVVPSECLDDDLAVERPAYDDLYAINGVFCATVGLGNFYGSELRGVIAEITYSGDDAHTPTQYPYGNAADPDGISGVNAPSASEGGMFFFGDIGAAGAPTDAVEALWTFNNTSNSPFNFEGRIVFDAVEICGNDLDEDCDGVADNDCREFETGDACDVARDCESGVCPDDVCVDPTCDDGVTNGDETGVDCGGSCPDNCLTEWSGVRNNVDQATLEGWSECYVDRFSASYVPINNMLDACDGDDILVGCRRTWTSTLLVAAHAPRATLFGTDDGTGRTTSRNINGTQWYYSRRSSFGFARVGDSISRNSCDTDISGANNQRLCIHTYIDGNIMGGYRCGDVIGLSRSNGWERVIMESGGVSGAGTCFDGIQNGDEDDVDCGGTLCPVCQPPTCDDGIENGDELGVDCGGPLCGPCACDDGVQNGDEAGVDCGGTYCDPCPFVPQCSAAVTNLTSSTRNVATGSGVTCDDAPGRWGSNPDWQGARWYRFTGDAGTRMPTSPPSTSSCGTLAPGWLNGAHPEVADGVVDRQVCFHWDGSTCRWNRPIQVVNCGDHYRYNLPTTAGICYLRYCGTD